MAKVHDCGLKVRGFEFQSFYNVHLRTYTLGKQDEPPNTPIMGWISLLFFYKDGFGIK